MTPRMRLGLVVAVAVATMVTVPPAVRADQPEPVRSGTIMGWGYTWPAMFSGEARDCQWSEGAPGGNPECLTWLKSGCSPTLAGREPALTASIVDVGELADGTTPRALEWRTGSPARTVPGTDAGGVVIQMWTQDCTEIRSSKWRSRDPLNTRRLVHRTETTFAIPADAKWMTVTTNDTVQLEWRLT